MLSAVFLVFFVGAIAALEEISQLLVYLKRSGLFELLMQLSCLGSYFVRNWTVESWQR